MFWTSYLNPVETTIGPTENETCIIYLGEGTNRQEMIGKYKGRNDRNHMMIFVDEIPSFHRNPSINNNKYPPLPQRVVESSKPRIVGEQKPATSNTLSMLELSSAISYDDYFYITPSQETTCDDKKKNIIKVGDLVYYNNVNCPSETYLRMRGIVTHINEINMNENESFEKYTVVMDQFTSSNHIDNFIVMSKICRFEELDLVESLSLIDLKDTLVLKFEKYARIYCLKQPNRKGTMTHSLSVPGVICKRVFVTLDDEEKPQCFSIGENEVYELVFDDQVMMEAPKNGQLVCAGMNSINSEKILFSRVINRYDNSCVGTLISYSPDFGLHIVLDKQNSSNKNELWSIENEHEYIFINQGLQIPKPNQAVTLPRTSLLAEEQNCKHVLGMRVKDIKCDRVGTIVGICIINEGNELSVWWDNGKMDTLKESQSGATCRFALSSNIECVGQVVTTVKKGFRVTRGPHMCSSHGNNVLGTIISGNEMEKTVSVLMDDKAWPITFSIGKDAQFTLSYANQHWETPVKGQLVTKGVRGCRVARCFAEIHNGKNWGTIYDVKSGGSAIRIIWHDTEKIEKISHLPDNLRFVCSS